MLVKLYHTEPGTYLARTIANRADNQVWLSRLTLIEAQSAFAIKVRTGFLDLEDARLSLGQFGNDLISRRFEFLAIGEPEFAYAEELIQRYAFHLRLRSLDAIQLAAATALRRRDLIDQFVSSDRVLCAVAAQEGFLVLNPEDE